MDAYVEGRTGSAAVYRIIESHLRAVLASLTSNPIDLDRTPTLRWAIQNLRRAELVRGRILGNNACETGSRICDQVDQLVAKCCRLGLLEWIQICYKSFFVRPVAQVRSWLPNHLIVALDRDYREVAIYLTEMYCLYQGCIKQNPQSRNQILIHLATIIDRADLELAHSLYRVIGPFASVREIEILGKERLDSLRIWDVRDSVLVYADAYLLPIIAAQKDRSLCNNVKIWIQFLKKCKNNLAAHVYARFLLCFPIFSDQVLQIIQELSAISQFHANRICGLIQATGFDVIEYQDQLIPIIASQARFCTLQNLDLLFEWLVDHFSIDLIRDKYYLLSHAPDDTLAALQRSTVGGEMVFWYDERDFCISSLDPIAIGSKPRIHRQVLMGDKRIHLYGEQYNLVDHRFENKASNIYLLQATQIDSQVSRYPCVVQCLQNVFGS